VSNNDFFSPFPLGSCTLDRSAYCCGEILKLKSVIDNQGEETVRLKVRLLQYCEFFVERGVIGLSGLLIDFCHHCQRQ
jgi:hypothetical protein